MNSLTVCHQKMKATDEEAAKDAAAKEPDIIPEQTVDTVEEKATEETSATDLGLQEEQELPPEAQNEEPLKETDKIQPVEQNEVNEQAAATATVKLNLRYNHKTGEYEPTDTHKPDDLSTSGKSEEGFKFGAGYDIKTDSFAQHDGKHK